MDTQDMGSASAEPYAPLTDQDVEAMVDASQRVTDTQTQLDDLNKLHHALQAARYGADSDVAVSLLSIACGELNVPMVKDNNQVQWQATMLSMAESIKNTVKAIIDKIIKWWTILSNLFNNTIKHCSAKIEELKALDVTAQKEGKKIMQSIHGMDPEAIKSRMSLVDNHITFDGVYNPTKVGQALEVACRQCVHLVRDLTRDNSPEANLSGLPPKITDALVKSEDRGDGALYKLVKNKDAKVTVNISDESQLHGWIKGLTDGYTAMRNLMISVESTQKKNQAHLKASQNNAQSDPEAAKALKESFAKVSKDQKDLVDSILRPGQIVLGLCLKSLHRLIKPPKDGEKEKEQPTKLSISDDYTHDDDEVADDLEDYGDFDAYEYYDDQLSIKDMASSAGEAIRRFIEWVGELFKKLFKRMVNQTNTCYRLRKSVTLALDESKRRAAERRDDIALSDEHHLQLLHLHSRFIILDGKIDARATSRIQERFHEDLARLLNVMKDTITNPPGSGVAPSDVIKQIHDKAPRFLPKLSDFFSLSYPWAYMPSEKLPNAKPAKPNRHEVDGNLMALQTMLHKEAVYLTNLERVQKELQKLLTKQVQDGKLFPPQAAVLSKEIKNLTISASVMADVIIHHARYFCSVSNAAPAKKEES